MALPPCHVTCQFYVDNNNKLSCHLYQRSGDVFLGIPWNIACYSLLTHLFAQSAGLDVGEFVHTIGDCHIYENHFEVVREQISREPLELPRLVLDQSVKSVLDFKHEHIRIEGYKSHGKLTGEVAV
jgi:thymidylate synthase